MIAVGLSENFWPGSCAAIGVCVNLPGSMSIAKEMVTFVLPVHYSKYCRNLTQQTREAIL
jgi:hypothetical protein